MMAIEFVIIIVLILLVIYLWKRLNVVQAELKSSNIKVGKWIEDFFPFAKDFPTSPENFKFLGEPIDGVAFDIKNEKIFFMEFKTGKSGLSEKQKIIKNLVEEKKVEWKEIYMH